jgi:hypothetical protein
LVSGPRRARVRAAARASESSWFGRGIFVFTSRVYSSGPDKRVVNFFVVLSGRFAHIIYFDQLGRCRPELESPAFFIKTRIEISMPEAPKPALEAETVRRMASEEVMLSLTQAEVEAIHNMLNSLLEEIRQIAPRDRAGAEPEASIVVEEWPA